MSKLLKLPTLRCKRCKSEWYPRSPERPKVCPRCKSPYWDKEYSRADLVRATR